MKTQQATLLDEEKSTTVSAAVSDNDFLIDRGDFARATGWDLKDRGLCRDDTCLPVEDPSAYLRDDRLVLSTVADRLDRPVAVETEPPVAYLGPPEDDVKNNLLEGTAPDFTLPTWTEDSEVSLSDFEGDKIFLLVWASW